MNKRKILKVGTFFSGIGSPEKALEKLKKDKVIQNFKIEFFSEIDKNAIKSYCAIHNIDEKFNLGNIKNIDGKYLPYCDLWIGGFPCQDISCAGKMKGFEPENKTRSSLGWEMIRLLNEVKLKPKYVIFENVSTITSKKFKKTLNLFKQDLMNLGYSIYDDILSAKDYEIPQIRRRYFLIAILNDRIKYEFPKKIDSNIKLESILDTYINEKYYLTNSHYLEVENKRFFKNKNRDDIVYEINMNKFLNGGVCGVDNHTVFEISKRLYSIHGYAPTLTASNTSNNCKLVEEKMGIMRIRKLSPKECWRLMGFEDEDFERASSVCSETNLYKQAGNSIVVNVRWFLSFLLIYK